MKRKNLVLSTGLAMFSMFFGSGNLVFPLLAGQMSEGHYFAAISGILLTAVLVPFLGILAILLFNGDSQSFFERLGKPAAFWFPLFALSLMGPFGVLARCITVAHGAFCLIFPHVSLWIFSFAACIVIFILSVKKNKIVPILGSILTPFLLLSLAAIAFLGLINMDAISMNTSGNCWIPFKNGFLQGYQTMDLLAAFFFSTFIIRHLKEKQAIDAPPISALSIFLQSSLIGAGLLASVYLILVLLGSMYASQLVNIPAHEMLGVIAQQTLGPWAAPIVCLAVILACLTTAIVLASLFADFLKTKISDNKLSNKMALIITLVIGFCISTLQFSGIMRFIAPLLEVIYPALIVLTIVSILHKLWGFKIVRTPVAVAVLLKFLSFGTL